MHAALVVLGVLSALNTPSAWASSRAACLPARVPGPWRGPGRFPLLLGRVHSSVAAAVLAIIRLVAPEPFNSTGWAGIAVLLVGFAILMTAHASESTRGSWRFWLLLLVMGKVGRLTW